MTPEDLKRIANEPGFGTGQRARDIVSQRADELRMLPDPKDMNEIIVSHGVGDGSLVANLGNDAMDGKDWFLCVDGYGLTSECEGARIDAYMIAAVWNAFMRGDLVRK